MQINRNRKENENIIEKQQKFHAQFPALKKRHSKIRCAPHNYAVPIYFRIQNVKHRSIQWIHFNGLFLCVAFLFF